MAGFVSTARRGPGSHRDDRYLGSLPARSLTSKQGGGVRPAARRRLLRGMNESLFGGSRQLSRAVPPGLGVCGLQLLRVAGCATAQGSSSKTRRPRVAWQVRAKLWIGWHSKCLSGRCTICTVNVGGGIPWLRAWHAGNSAGILGRFLFSLVWVVPLAVCCPSLKWERSICTLQLWRLWFVCPHRAHCTVILRCIVTRAIVDGGRQDLIRRRGCLRPPRFG